MKDRIPIIVLTGPTGSGKSGLSIKLAKKLNGEIISIDSMQIYKEMNIGTGKITKEEQAGIPHYMLDEKEPSEEFSVAEYIGKVRGLIDDISTRGKTPFLVGGTTLYIQSIIDNIIFFDLPRSQEIRDKLEAFSQENGNEALLEKLLAVDPKLGETLHYNNKGRIIRALEVYEISGKPMSYWHEKSISEPSPYNHLLLGLNYRSREVLYERINSRVDTMLKDGLLEEIDHLKTLELSKTAKQAIGYKELWNFRESEEALLFGTDKIKMETRRYAKRQLTWMRSREELFNIYKEDFENEDELAKYTETLVTSFLSGQ